MDERKRLRLDKLYKDNPDKQQILGQTTRAMRAFREGDFETAYYMKALGADWIGVCDYNNHNTEYYELVMAMHMISGIFMRCTKYGSFCGCFLNEYLEKSDPIGAIINSTFMERSDATILAIKKYIKVSQENNFDGKGFLNKTLRTGFHTINNDRFLQELVACRDGYVHLSFPGQSYFFDFEHRHHYNSAVFVMRKINELGFKGVDENSIPYIVYSPSEEINIEFAKHGHVEFSSLINMTKFGKGRTALIYLANHEFELGGSILYIRKLIDCGADTQLLSRGSGAYDYALGRGRIELANLISSNTKSTCLLEAHKRKTFLAMKARTAYKNATQYVIIQTINTIKALETPSVVSLLRYINKDISMPKPKDVLLNGSADREPRKVGNGDEPEEDFYTKTCKDVMVFIRKLKIKIAFEAISACKIDIKNVCDKNGNSVERYLQSYVWFMAINSKEDKIQEFIRVANESNFEGEKFVQDVKEKIREGLETRFIRNIYDDDIEAVDFNISMGCYSSYDKFDNSVCDYSRSINMSRFLFSNGFNSNSPVTMDNQDFGEKTNALMYGLKHLNDTGRNRGLIKETLDALLKAGADVKKEDDKGRTVMSIINGKDSQTLNELGKYIKENISEPEGRPWASKATVLKNAAVSLISIGIPTAVGSVCPPVLPATNVAIGVAIATRNICVKGQFTSDEVLRVAGTVNSNVNVGAGIRNGIENLKL